MEFFAYEVRVMKAGHISREGRVMGCLFGLAFGDALGAPTEFLSLDEILRRWPPRGPVDLIGDPIKVTDDTQMALAVGEALVMAINNAGLSPKPLEALFRQEFIRWLNSPDNNRAPGMTCLKACENLEAGAHWINATVRGSKGCGANMRVAPVGLLSQRSLLGGESMRAGIAQLQAAMTHGHPTALAASDLTAFTIARITEGIELQSLPGVLRSYAMSQREVYHTEWLEELWQRPGYNAPEEFIIRGWDECLTVLDRLEDALSKPDYDADPCLATGQGWVAEEAFATGLLCFLMYPDNPRQALERAAVTSGDSDSIACLAGAFAGACMSVDCWPQDWLQKIEYRNRIALVADELSKHPSEAGENRLEEVR